MTKEKYLKISENDPDEINLSNTDIIDWINNIVNALVAARENIYPLSWGKLNLDEGEYENEISPCVVGDYEKLHVYRGIEKIAEAVCTPLLVEKRRDNEYPYEFYFYYRGVRIFQIEKENHTK